MTRTGRRDGYAGEAEPFLDERTGFRGWRFWVGAGRGIPTPAVVDGRVYFGGGFGSHEVYALEGHSGHLRWQLRTRDDGPTAVVGVGRFVAFNTESCTLEVVDALDGRPMWERWLGDPLLAQPAMAGHRVVMAYPRAGRHWLGAFDLASGDPLWETALGHDVITAPVVAEGHVFLSTFDGTVWSIDPSSGAVLWQRSLDATSAPWVNRGEVYVARRTREPQGASGSEERAMATAPPDVGASPRARARAVPTEETTAWDATVGAFKARHQAKEAAYLSATWGVKRKRAFLAADAAVGFARGPAAAKLDDVRHLIGETSVARTWRFQGSRPVVVEGVLYETTGDRLEASDVVTGQRRWGWSAAKAVEGERRLTPPAVARGRVLAGTWDGRVLSWDAAAGAIVWEVEVGAPCHWQPVMAGGWVYAGLEDGSVVAFDTRDPACDGWPMWGGGAGHNG